MSTDLVTRSEEEQALKACLTRVAQKAAKTIEGLYEDPGSRDYNPDAEKTWAECSMKTRASLIIHKATEGKQEADLGRAFGVIILTARASSPADWEAQAKAVDEAERKKAAIDVVATVVR